MKTLFNNPSKIFKYTLTFMSFVLLLGLIFSLTFGFNTSSEYGKVYEVSIYCFDNSKIETYENQTKEILKDYGYSAKETIIEEHTDCDALVIRYASTSENNAIKIQKDITTKLELNENLVNVESLSLSNHKSESIKLMVTLGVVALVLFVYALLRHNIKFAIALISNLILSAILPISIIAFTRIELSLTGLYIVSIFASISSILYMFVYSKIKSIEKQQEKIVSFKENYINYIDAIKTKALIPIALIALIFIALIFTLNRGMLNVGLTGIVSLLVCLFNLVVFAPNFQIVINKETSKN